MNWSIALPGKPKGAPGGALLQAHEPDETKVHVPATCSSCAADLSGTEVVSVEKRQVFDLPEIQLHVVEHQIQRRRCTCGTITAAHAPDPAASPAQYGPRIKALAVYLATRQHLPYERCAELLADCLGADVATSTLIGWNAAAAQAVAPHTEAVRQQLIACDLVGFDEPSSGCAGWRQQREASAVPPCGPTSTTNAAAPPSWPPPARSLPPDRTRTHGPPGPNGAADVIGGAVGPAMPEEVGLDRFVRSVHRDGAAHAVLGVEVQERQDAPCRGLPCRCRRRPPRLLVGVIVSHTCRGTRGTGRTVSGPTTPT
nr:transposase [Streptomyces sp. NBC_00830]